MQTDNNQVLRPRRLLKCTILLGLFQRNTTVEILYNVKKTNKKMSFIPMHACIKFNIIEHLGPKYKSPLSITFFKF